MTQCSARQNQRDSPLLRLPPEIRNQIFEYALGGHTIWLQDAPKWRRGVKHKKTRNLLALLAVSRQAYAETAMIAFSLNTFCADYSESMATFLRDRSSTSIIRVDNIQIDCHISVYSPFYMPSSYCEASTNFWLPDWHFTGLLALKKVAFSYSVTNYTLGLDSSLIQAGIEKRQRTMEHFIKSQNADLVVSFKDTTRTKTLPG